MPDTTARKPGRRGDRHRRPPADPGQPPARPGSPEWQRAVAANLNTLASLLAAPAKRTMPALHATAGGTVGWHEAVAADLVSLNDLAAELIAAVAADPDFAGMVSDILRDHTWALGYTWRGTSPPDGWVPWWAGGQTPGDVTKP